MLTPFVAAKLETNDAIPENPVGEMLLGDKNTLKATPIKNVPSIMVNTFKA